MKPSKTMCSWSRETKLVPMRLVTEEKSVWVLSHWQSEGETAGLDSEVKLFGAQPIHSGAIAAPSLPLHSHNSPVIL